MSRLAGRLASMERTLQELEQATRSSQAYLKVFWQEQLTPCPKHAHCDVEPEIGMHHRDVVHLSFGQPSLVEG